MTEADPLGDAVRAGPGGGSPDQPHASERQNVYIVDDDPAVRRSLSFALGTAGYQTRAFASGQDFLDEVEALAPGCVLMDVRMPKLDGLGVLKQLGSRIGRFAVVTMTGHGDIETAVRAMKLGSLDFIEKPFADAALKEVLDAASPCCRRGSMPIPNASMR